MADFRISPALAEMAVTSSRYEVLGRIGIDISAIGTWDRRLSRRTRILVPVDVQAYVVPTDGSEETVELTGDPATDPAPLAAGTVKPSGVHLHWAMPDALLDVGHDVASGEPRMPDLPDQWVVVRTLQPVGQRQVVATGWVVDARTRAITPLSGFTGPVATMPAGAIDPLNGFSGGVGWTASYGGSRMRFTFHDPLDDVAEHPAAPEGVTGNQAVYTVAGWWSDLARDPLSSARGSAALDRTLASRGWRVEHDADDQAHVVQESRRARLLRSAGMDAPRQTAKTRIIGGDGRRVSGALDGIDLSGAYPVAEVGEVWHGEALPTYNTLLHGSVLGVPVDGVLPAADDRPDPAAVSIALGSDVDDVLAAFGAAGLGLSEDQRRASEDLLAAFSSGLVSQLGSPDGIDALGEREHANGFWALPGTPVTAARADRLRREDTLAAGPTTVGRKGRAAAESGRGGKHADVAALAWRKATTFEESRGSKQTTNPKASESRGAAGTVPETREVTRPAPRFFRPAPLVLAVRGARPSHRHHGDGLHDDKGMLLCRYPSTAVPGMEGLVGGASILPTLGSGAIPEEVTTVVREAVLLNPYGYQWLVDASAPEPDVKSAVSNRVLAEMVRLYGADGRYDGTSHVEVSGQKADVSAWESVDVELLDLERKLSAEVAQFSAFGGLPPSPVAITTWRQPWAPLWVEWRVTLTGTTTTTGWHLDGYDLEPDDGAAGSTFNTTLEGRSLLGQGVGEALRRAVVGWLDSESQRQVTNRRSAHGDSVVLQQLSGFDHPLDLVSASLDGIREQLLGIDYVGLVARSGTAPAASGAPSVLFGGELRLDDLRLVDAFGRTVQPPDSVLDATRTTLELEVGGSPRTVRLRPRLQHSARWLWRLVDPRQPRDTAPEELVEAYVDQVDPAAAVNPVAGFLLPDHIDESLETFTVSGRPIGEVGHDPISNAVTWEPAPGRPVPPDAGPLVDLDAQARIVGEIAAGMVRVDAAARASASPPATTALAAFLRAVDTTLWTVDAFAGLGTGTLAGLVGRPIAVVRASLTLDAPDDLDEVEVTAAGGPTARRDAFDRLVEEVFEAQLGTIGRSDDTLLGYFVDDDYERLHLVDKVATEHARLSGRHLGQLGLLGQTAVPGTEPLEHPYLVADDTLLVRRGQAVRLTMLMLPGGRVHLTSGILPRKQLALADSWFTPGLRHLLPSVRVGPLLVDPAEVRLPLVNVLGEHQTFTRRTGELAWKDDAILAATQTAYLPRLPHEVQEGWIRVTPPDEETS